MAIERIKASSIITHWKLNRFKMEYHVLALAGHMNEHGFDENYPLRVIVIDGERHLAAGHHRLAAARLEGIIDDTHNPRGQIDVKEVYPNLPLTYVWADLQSGTLDDVIRVMQEDNFVHDPAVQATVGLPLTRAQKVDQCKRLLMFPEYYGRSGRSLEPVFGVSRKTIDRWKDEVSGTLSHCAAAAHLSEEQLILQFSVTRERLDRMMEIIESGERLGEDGRVTRTQASAEKKADIRSTAIQLFRETHDAVMRGIDAVVVGCPSQARETVKRRLYQAFGLNHAANASKWPTDKVTTETEMLASLKTELQTPGKSLWWEEFRRLHKVKKYAEELTSLGAPYLSDEVGRILHEAQHTETADFEALSQSERLNNSERIGNQLLSVLVNERDARNVASGKHATNDSSPPPSQEPTLEPEPEPEPEPVGRGAVPRAEPEPVVRGTVPRAEEVAEPMEVDVPEQILAEHRQMARVARDAANAIGSVMSLANRPMPSNVDFLNDYIQQFCPEAVERLGLLRSLILRTANELD